MLKRTILVMLATTTMLTPAVWAGHNDHRFTPPNRTVVLADDLLDATRHMQRLVEQRQRGRKAHSRNLLFALDRLERRAGQLRIDAVRGVAPRHLEAQLDRLLAAFERSEREMQLVRSQRLQRDFNCVERAVRLLARDVEIASARSVNPRRRGGPHGAIVIGDRGRDSRFQFRIRF